MKQLGGSFDDYTLFNRWGLTLLGVWRHERLEGPQRQVLVVVMSCLMITLMIPQWLDYYALWGDIDANAETAASNVFTMSAFIKLVYILKERRTFLEVMETLRKNWNATMQTSGNEEHRRVLVEYAEEARAYTRRYVCLIYAALLTYCIAPILGARDGRDLRARPYPFFGWYYFDQDSDFYYRLCYAVQVVTGFVVGTANHSLDCIFIVAVYHTCAQFRKLQHEIRTMGRDARGSSAEDIARLVRRHQQEIT